MLHTRRDPLRLARFLINQTILFRRCIVVKAMSHGHWHWQARAARHTCTQRERQLEADLGPLGQTLNVKVARYALVCYNRRRLQVPFRRPSLIQHFVPSTSEIRPGPSMKNDTSNTQHDLRLILHVG